MSKHRRNLIEQQLSDRDWRVLELLAQFRFLTTRQVSRHIYRATPTDRIPRQINRLLAKLTQLHLISHLARRIGGVRAGSAGYVWQLTETGRRLAIGASAKPSSRVRAFEPTTTFLEHTLAVAETAMTLVGASSGGNVTLTNLETEPQCWRPYLDSHGVTVRLKPDLAVTSTSHGFEDHWFFEVDRATEAPSRIVRKCLQYQSYQRTDTEQQRAGVFPAVVWVVPTTARKDQLRERIRQEHALNQRLFTVITIDQLPLLIERGTDAFQQLTSGQHGGHHP